MVRNVVRGIVRRIEPVFSDLTLVTLDPIYEESSQLKTPVYMKVNPEFLGKPVDIMSQRSGLFGSCFQQAMVSADLNYSTIMGYWQVKRISQAYREREARSATQ